jgi:hypothetical protein
MFGSIVLKLIMLHKMDDVCLDALQLAPFFEAISEKTI